MELAELHSKLKWKFQGTKGHERYQFPFVSFSKSILIPKCVAQKLSRATACLDFEIQVARNQLFLKLCNFFIQNFSIQFMGKCNI